MWVVPVLLFFFFTVRYRFSQAYKQSLYLNTYNKSNKYIINSEPQGGLGD